MELIIYNRENISTSRVGQKTINVGLHGGQFTFSSAVARELKLQEGTKLFIAQQKSNAKNWFLSIEDNNNPHAFTLAKNKDALLFRCTAMARKILMSFKEPKSVRFIVTGDTQEFAGKIFYQLVPIAKKEKK